MRSLVLLFSLVTSVARADSVEEARALAIMNAFNSMPTEIVAPLTREQVKLRGGSGRVDVNVKAKFSYYAQVLEPSKLESEVLLVPMATSRYVPAYYQTDDWWEANKDKIAQAKASGSAPPRQDEVEVEQWLRKMKLSTDPLVIKLNPATGTVERTRLKQYLADLMIEKFAQDGFITLYRGAEKPGEFDAWNAGQRPKGVRYWSPNVDYAWRYARKNLDFLDELVAGRTPLFKFRVPVAEFRRLALEGRYPDLTLGTELTKNAHNAFDREGVFKDHLYNTDYTGSGPIAVEIEVRGNRTGANVMANYYAGAVTAQDLALGRVRALTQAMTRLVSQFPERARETRSAFQERIQRTLAEGRILAAVRAGKSKQTVLSLLSALPSGEAEIANIDGTYFEAFVNSKAEALPSGPVVTAAELDREFGL